MTQPDSILSAERWIEELQLSFVSLHHKGPEYIVKFWLEQTKKREDAVRNACTNWKPIETAPMDRTIVDLWFSEQEIKPEYYPPYKTPAYRVPNCYFRHGEWMTDSLDRGEVSAGYYINSKPSHYMPLPTPPVENESDTISDDQVAVHE